MLTRERAKNGECPLRAAGFWANPSNDMSPGKGALNCRAENCPMWRDYEIGSGYLCSQERDYVEKYNQGMSHDTIVKCREKHDIGTCTTCPDRFGYCGS